MFTASQKKKENIAEYLLYMWQIEDLIRALGLDIERINRQIVNQYSSLTVEQRKELSDWYESLIDMMRRENVVESGHLQINKNTLNDLSRLHNELLADEKFADYNAEFYRTLPYIVELRAKAGEQKPSEIEAAFNALYGLLLLRLQGKDVSQQTLDATKQISRFLALLSNYYKKEWDGTLFDEPRK